MRAVDRLNLQHSIYRAAGLLRAALLVLTCVVNVTRARASAHPVLLVVAMLAMLAWTGAVWIWNQIPERRTLAWMGADIAFTLVLVASSRYVLGGALLAQSMFGVTVYWMVCAPVVVGIWKGPVAGALAGALVGLVNFAQLPSLNPRVWIDFICMVIVPALGGFIADELSHLVAQRDQSSAAAASLAERDRLNRIVHDGVLQVLAMVEREGSELGGRGAELASLAHEQETRLRAMLQGQEPTASGGSVDLVGLLGRRATQNVSVSSMAGSLMVPDHLAEEVDAAVGEALANVAKHAGAGAQAWILVEDDGENVVVSVRDDGVGMSADAVSQASEHGRLGVAESIQGRIRSLGGVALWQSKPGEGVEWEMWVPHKATVVPTDGHQNRKGRRHGGSGDS